MTLSPAEELENAMYHLAALVEELIRVLKGSSE
jgi:hypothetical protein